MSYAVKAIFDTLQGEGARAGTRAVFVRLAGCNLWDGRPENRARGAGACARWCFTPDMPVLLSDWTYAPIGSLQPGQRVMCAVKVGSKMRLDVTTITNVQTRVAPLARLSFGDGDVTGTADHPVWRCQEGHGNAGEATWVPAEDAVGARVPSLAPPPPPIDSALEWERGWLAGVAFGDGCFWTLRKQTQVRSVPYDRSSSWTTAESLYRRFRLAVNDEAILHAFKMLAGRHGVTLYEGPHQHTGFGGPGVMPAIWLTQNDQCVSFEKWLAAGGGEDYAAGFLAGTLDAEGTIGKRSIYLAQDAEANPENYARIEAALRLLGFENTAGPDGFNIHTGDRQRWRFMLRCRPVLARKRDTVLGASLEQSTDRLTAVTKLGVDGEVVALTTEAGNYILAGHLVKNCDTDFVGGIKMDAQEIVDAADALWNGGAHRWVVLTGGEPTLQLDEALVVALHSGGWSIAIETNGTVDNEAIEHVDWVTVSPKLGGQVKLHRLGTVDTCELKVVLPGSVGGEPGWSDAALLELAGTGPYRFKFVQPMDPPLSTSTEDTLHKPAEHRSILNHPNTRHLYDAALDRCIDFVKQHPDWRLGAQLHKGWKLP